MSQKTILIFYSGEEKKLEINIDETNSYDLFMVKIHSLINDYDSSKTYQLMAINTSEPYTLLSEDNYMKIMKENINDDDLKLFLDKKDINSDENNENNQNTNINNPPVPAIIPDNKINENEDEDDDEDFVIEKENKEDEKNEKDKNENNKINEESKEEIDKQIKIDENINNNINDDNDNENLYKETDDMINKIKNVLGHSKSENFSEKEYNKRNDNINTININNNINSNSKEDKYNLLLKEDDDDNDDNNNIINNDNNNNNKIISENNDKKSSSFNLIKPETFISIKCSLCNNNLLGIKYICCVCENCILCKDCELEHFHPCLKFKSQFLSNLSDIYKFISQFYSLKIPSNNIFTKIFKKECEIKMRPLSDKKICLRPRKETLFPIKVSNLSKEIVNSSKFQIIPKDNKLVQIYYEANNRFSLGPNSNFTVKMKCITGKKLGTEKINFYAFSEELKFKNQSELNFSIEFEINDDEEEEKMNKKLEYNENVIVYNKEHKNIALNILESIGDKNRNKTHIDQVFNILMKSNWNKDKAINQIKALKK